MMAIQKNIVVDGIEVPFKASAAIPRLYRLKFRRDIYQDLNALQKAMQEQKDQTTRIRLLPVWILFRWNSLKTSPTSWQNTLTQPFRLLRMNGWNSSTRSAFTKSCHS